MQPVAVGQGIRQAWWPGGVVSSMWYLEVSQQIILLG